MGDQKDTVITDGFSAGIQSTLPKGSKSLASLVYFIVFIGVFFSILLAVSPTYMDGEGSERVHWMVPLGIAIMVVFMPLTAISFLHYRLPKKQKELEDIKVALGNSEHGVEAGSILVDTEYKSSDYLLPVLFVSLFSTLGFYILLSGNAQVLFKAVVWANEGGDANEIVYRTSLVACGFAFLGAYIWSIQYIFKRMMTLDLPPGAYYSVGTRLVFSSFLILIYSHFTQFDEGSRSALPSRDDVSIYLPLVAFLTGIFPERLLNWLKDSAGSLFVRGRRLAHTLPLEMVEGIDSFHKARLSELGIDNVQNLAHASLVELIIKTPFKPRVIADWMAQARLCLEFKSDVHKIRNGGIRSILDFIEVMEKEGMAENLATLSEIDESLLHVIYRANHKEESIERLRVAYDRLMYI